MGSAASAAAACLAWPLSLRGVRAPVPPPAVVPPPRCLSVALASLAFRALVRSPVVAVRCSARELALDSSPRPNTTGPGRVLTRARSWPTRGVTPQQQAPSDRGAAIGSARDDGRGPKCTVSLMLQQSA